jgi:predicted nucleotidyltransferase
LKVDIMPMRDPTGSFSDGWFEYALQTAGPRTLNNVTISTVSATCFVATKLNAFTDRGQGDFRASHDLEDLLAVVDGRKTLCAELAAERDDLRQYVAASIASMLNKPAFMDALPGHLPPDDASQARLPLLTERLSQIAALGKSS